MRIRTLANAFVLLLVAVTLMAPMAAVAGPVGSGELGSFCNVHEHCRGFFSQCADGRKCAPKNGVGQPGQYCHHNNHCQSGFCRCNKGGFGFCRDWERWPSGVFDASSTQSPYIQIGICD